MPKRKILSSKRSYAVVLTSCGSRPEAKKIAESLVAGCWAACVSISGSPVRSIYRWKGKMERADEFVLVIKTARDRLPELQAQIQRLHSYEVPEFLVLPVAAGSRAYLQWLDDCLRGS